MSHAPRKLDVVRGSDAPGPQLRHPEDGWTLAEPLRVSRGTKRVISAITDAIVPTEPRYDGMLADLVENFLILLRYMPRSTQVAFIFGLHVLNFAPLWRLRDIRTITALPRERAESVLRGITQSRLLPIRLLMLGPQAMLLSAFFDSASIHPHLDYDPVSFAEGRIELRQRLLRGEEISDSDLIDHRPQVQP